MDINTYAVTTGTSPSLTTDYFFTSIGSALRRMSLALVGQVIGFIQGGTTPTTVRMQDKLRDMMVSVLDYGAVRTSTAPGATGTASDTAFANALSWAINTTTANTTANRGSGSLTNLIHVPAGYYRLANPLEIPANGNNSVTFVGEGINDTHVYMNTADTTALACVTIATGTNNRSIVVGMQDMHWKYYGTQTRTTLHGILITHKVNMLRTCWDSFPGDGGKFETSLAGNNTWCVFFANFKDCVFQNNGQHGLNLRYGANANMLLNCSFIGNVLDGYIHQTDGTAIYGNVLYGGSAHDNGNYGYNHVNGTNTQAYGVQAYGNNGTYDWYQGDSGTRSYINFGYIQSTARVRLPGGASWGNTTGTNATSIQIKYGGSHGFGART